MKHFPILIKSRKPGSSPIYQVIYKNRIKGHTVIVTKGGNVSYQKSDGSTEDWNDALTLKTSRENPDFFSFIPPYMEGKTWDEIYKSDECKRFICALAQAPGIHCEVDEFVMIDGKRPSKDPDPSYELVIPYYESKKRAGNIKNRTAVANHYMNLPYEEQQNIAWYFGVDPRNLTDDDLLEVMIGDSGVALNDTSSYIRKFIETDELISDDMVRVIAIKKAMQLSRNEGTPMEFKSGRYYIGDTFVGGSEDDVQAFFNSPGNSRHYDALISELEPTKAKKPRGRKAASAE